MKIYLIWIIFFFQTSFTQQYNYQTDMLIFSFNRPMQLYALLESTQKYIHGLSKIFIIYRASKEFEKGYLQVKKDFPACIFYKQGDNPYLDFKPLVLKILNKKTSYIVFAVDDIIVKDYIDINECVKKLSEEKAFGFYLRFGKNISYNYTRRIPAPLPKGYNTTPQIYKWYLSNGKGGWEYARNLDMTIYNKKDIFDEIYIINFRSPNELEGYWNRKVTTDMSGLCYNFSKTVNIPINVVNEFFSGRNANFYSTHDLLEKFNKNLKIDIRPFHKIKNSSVHQEYKYNFIPRIVYQS